ncbi:MAG: hypothetical protein VXA40_08355 [Gammaproteobacteria bacterium]
MAHVIPAEAEIAALVGHQFPGGRYTIAHWENYLLTECTGAEPMPDDLAHPVALFHVPILGAGTSIAEMFTLGQAESGVSIGIESYDWEFFHPLREEQPYDITGVITSAERKVEAKRMFDRIQFQFDLHDDVGTAVARTTVTWHYRRTAQ